MNENSDSYPLSGNNPESGNTSRPVSTAPKQPSIIIHNHIKGKSFWTKILVFVLVISLFMNFSMISQNQEYYSDALGPMEKYHSGDKDTDNKIAIVSVDGTIMPPFTERVIDSIRKAKKDSNVKGVILSIDSPGGIVADSHQIYHELKLLTELKPVHVIMKRTAASGGLYVAMGAGKEAKIFAEPTCWTGSIGVIIPHYDLSGLAEKIGINPDSLKTGEFKDSLNYFKKMSESEIKLWEEIIDDAFQRFLNLIAENRPDLNYEDVKKLATGQVYTANQAKENKLIDEIGFEEDAIDSLKEKLQLSKARIVHYDHIPSFMDILGSSEANAAHEQWKSIMESTVPRAMYYFSWLPVTPDAGVIKSIVK